MVDAVGTAAAAFAATNVDDLVLLSVLFARRTPAFRAPHIVTGQYLGFGLLVAVSFAVGLGLLALPSAAVGVLGLVPVALGLRGLIAARRHPEDGAEADVVTGGLSTMGVAAITIANGADNVAIYAPLFATVGRADAIVTLAVFAGLVAVWCLAALAIGTRRAVVRLVERAGAYAVPVVLVALGVLIVAESGLLG